MVMLKMFIATKLPISNKYIERSAVGTSPFGMAIREYKMKHKATVIALSAYKINPATYVLIPV